MTEQKNNQIESGGVAGPIGSPTPDQQSLDAQKVIEYLNVSPPDDSLGTACAAYLERIGWMGSAERERGPGIEGEAGA